MYQRLMNRLDINNVIDVPSRIKSRMIELSDMLDDAYGVNRLPSDMGGYILLFPTPEDVNESFDSVMKYYNIDPALFEYRDTYSFEKQIWIEELYLLTSEDSLVLIYPKEVTDNG